MGPDSYASTGMVVFLFAMFTAYWAQTINRSAWLWFSLGLLLPPITGVVLLHKNGRARAPERAA